MIDTLKLTACVLAPLFKSRARLEARFLVLRHQLMILRRKVPPRLRVSFVDRLDAFVILRQDRRRIRSVAVASHPTAEWVARQIAEAFPRQETPRAPRPQHRLWARGPDNRSP